MVYVVFLFLFKFVVFLYYLRILFLVKLLLFNVTK